MTHMELSIQSHCLLAQNSYFVVSVALLLMRLFFIQVPLRLRAALWR